MNKQKVYEMAVKQWGKPMQIIMALEEMSELTKELTKNLRGKENIIQVCEEIADVEIMLEQLKVIFDKKQWKDGTTVEIAKQTKLARLAGMVQRDDSAKDVVNRLTGEDMPEYKKRGGFG